jgi:hypothetical protein
MSRLGAFRALAAREAGVAWRGGAGTLDRGLSAAAFLAAVLAIWAHVSASRSHERAFAARADVEWLFRGVLAVAALLAPLAFVRLLARDRERGVLDLLLLSPVGATGLLAAKTAGRALGFTAVLGAGLPALLLLLPLGGVSFGELLSLQIIVLGMLLACGGVAAFFSSLLRGSLPALSASWALLGLWVAVPFVPGAAAIPSFAGLIERELRGLSADPWAAALALATGAGFLLAGCGAGGLVLRRRHVEGRSENAGERVGAALRAFVARKAATPRWAKWFRPLFPSRHPLVRRESYAGRDLVFRIGWLVLAGVAGAAALLLVFRADRLRFEHHAAFAVLGVGGGLVLAALHGAVSFASARRRGLLETYLAANVEPDEILRARAAGIAQRAVYLALPWLIYLGVAAGAYSLSLEEVARGLLSLAGLAVAVGTVAVGTLTAAILFRRTVLAAAGALAAAGVAVMASGPAAGAVWGVALFTPLWAAGLMALHAFNVRRFRSGVLR